MSDTERDERLREARELVQEARVSGFTQIDSETVFEIDDALARLDAVVTAVRKVHKPVPYGSPETRAVAPWVPENVCSHCLAEYDGCVAYPCPTVRALDGGAW